MENKPILQGTHNTRELGGYPLKEGRQTKENRFLRSDSLCGITLEDRQLLKHKGLSLVIDLRSQYEQEQSPDPKLSVPHLSFPLLDQVNSGMSSAGFPSNMGDVYIGLLDHSQDTIRRIFEAMAETEGCILFHCSAGKDRTGVTAMLLLDLAGADEDLIIEDYAASAFNLYPHLQDQMEMLQKMGVKDPDALLGSPKSNMIRTLEHLRKMYGTAEKYLRKIGVSDAKIEVLKASLQERVE